MKTIENYVAEQKPIRTMSDMLFTEQTLINKIPATALLRLLYEVNQLTFTDGFGIQAVAEMDEAICHEATQFKVLINIGYGGECEISQMNPAKKYIFTFELKNNQTMNERFELFYEKQTGNECNGYLNFLTQFSENKIYLD